MPETRKRSGHSVALIGGDGSGKTSIARRLVDDPRLNYTYLYMGPSRSSASHLLPTSRLVLRLRRVLARKRPEHALAPDSLAARNRPVSLPRFIARSLLQFTEVIHRELRLRSRLVRGIDVVCDRHILFEILPADDPATSVERARNVYARILRFVSRPLDCTILLMADPDVMLKRKGEADSTYLERRNLEWWDIAVDDRLVTVVDANRGLDEVYADVVAVLPVPQRRA